MLIEFCSTTNLATLLLPLGKYRPFPTIEERSSWESLPEELRSHIIRRGEKYLDFGWPCLPAARYMDFYRNGNRSRYEDLYFERRNALGSMVVAECTENKGRYIDQIINGIWCICEETSWVLPAHCKVNGNIAGGQTQPLPDVNVHTIDLFSAETGALLSWIDYLMGNRLDAESPLIREHLRYAVETRILSPYINRDDIFWLGVNAPKGAVFNNWNPWCNSNCLAAVLLMEKDAEKRILGVQRAMESLDRFIGGYPSDGGCDEGPGYWCQAGGSLFDCLELLYGAAGGRINVYQDPKIKSIGSYIYKTHIHRDYFVNFADGDAKVRIPSELVYRYGCRTEDQQLSAMGSYAYHNGDKQDPYKLQFPSWHPMFRVLSAIFGSNVIMKDMKEAPYIRDAWFDGIQVMTARVQEGSCKGLYLAVKGGHNAESHNHNDVGNFIAYLDGAPLFIDVGVETYTARLFSARRYEIWAVQSSYHNLPEVREIQQKPGVNSRAEEVEYKNEADRASVTMNIASAYPREAGIVYWRRAFSLHRGSEAHIDIQDDFKLEEPSDRVVLYMMTPCSCRLDDPGRVAMTTSSGHNALLEYDSDVLKVYSEYIEIKDKKLGAVWGDHIYRLAFYAKKPVDQGKWVMKIKSDER